MPPNRRRRGPRVSPATGETKKAVRIRMYRQGLGDCFLLTFDPEGSPAHVLIDFGTLGSSLGNEMEGVAKDIVASTGGRIDLLVATHEHQDHVSGFPRLKKASDKGDLKIERVWMAWTENSRNTRAEALRNKKEAYRDDLRLALAAAGVAANEPVGLGIRDLLGFAGDPVMLGAADFAKTVDAAMDGMRTGLGFEAEYLNPGQLIEPDWLPGFRFYVLGPPKEDRFLNVLGEHGDDRIYEMKLGLRADSGAATGTSDAARGEIPFDVRFQRKGENLPGFEEYYRKENAWRRIDENWLETAALLALQLDNLTNNTSLALAIERIPDGKVFLFPADAQLGNWVSWHEPGLQWEIPASGGRFRRVNAEDLLKRTVFYKVGHHGSHNATAKEHGLEKMANSDELIAFIPVDRSIALGRNPKGSWQMPAKTLYRTLLEKCQGRVLRADSGWAKPPPEGSEAEKVFSDLFESPQTVARWTEAQQRAKVGIKPLFIDLPVP